MENKLVLEYSFKIANIYSTWMHTMRGKRKWWNFLGKLMFKKYLCLNTITYKNISGLKYNLLLSDVSITDITAYPGGMNTTVLDCNWYDNYRYLIISE